MIYFSVIFDLFIGFLKYRKSTHEEKSGPLTQVLRTELELNTFDKFLYEKDMIELEAPLISMISNTQSFTVLLKK